MIVKPITGKVWILQTNNGTLIEDIDTDQIFHNAYLHITELDRMGPYALGNLEGWKDFPQKAGPGDIVIAGRNFGAGSSRQQAVDCFIALKTGLLMAPSFGAIYFRNAVNSGFPLMRGGELPAWIDSGGLATGDEITVDFQSGELVNRSRNASFRMDPMSGVQMDILRAGGLFAYAKDLNSG